MSKLRLRDLPGVLQAWRISRHRLFCALARRIIGRNAQFMGALKIALSSYFLLCAVTSQARADEDLAIAVASCVGRYSAELEHAWLMRDPRSEVLSRQREGFVSILEAITPAAKVRDILNRRIDAKYAHARLLMSATFGTAPSDAAWAKRQSDHFMQNCAAMLLES